MRAVILLMFSDVNAPARFQPVRLAYALKKKIQKQSSLTGAGQRKKMEIILGSDIDAQLMRLPLFLWKKHQLTSEALRRRHK